MEAVGGSEGPVLSFVLDFKWVLQIPGAHSKVPRGLWGHWEVEPLEFDTCQPQATFP